MDIRAVRVYLDDGYTLCEAYACRNLGLFRIVELRFAVRDLRDAILTAISPSLLRLITWLDRKIKRRKIKL